MRNKLNVLAPCYKQSGPLLWMLPYQQPLLSAGLLYLQLGWFLFVEWLHARRWPLLNLAD